MRVSTPHGWDTNPSQVGSQQTYLPHKDGKQSYLRWEKRSHKCSNCGKAGIELGTLWSEGTDLTNCTNHAHPKNTAIYAAKINWLDNYTGKPPTFSGTSPLLK